MSQQKAPSITSGRNATLSNISKEDAANPPNKSTDRNGISFSGNKKDFINQNLSLLKSLENRTRSKSPNPKTLKELRNISSNDRAITPDRVSRLTHHINREKVEHKLSTMMNKGFEKCEDFKEVLKKIFVFYASFGDRIHQDSLKPNNLIKLINDTGLVDKTVINQTNISILICKHNAKSSKITFDKFLLILVDLASMKYPHMPQKEAFLTLFGEVFKPLYFSLYKDTNLGEHDVLFQEPIEPETIMLVGEVVPTLQKMYRLVFAVEYQTADYKTAKTKSELLLPSFFKEYELFPFLINLTMGHSLFQQVLNVDKAYLKQHFTFPGVLEKDEGIAFTFKRFLLFLIRIALAGFSSVEYQENLAQQDKLMLLLEKMEVSPGFVSFRKAIAPVHPFNVSLLPTIGAIRKVLNKTYLPTEVLSSEKMDTLPNKRLDTIDGLNITQWLNNIQDHQPVQHDSELQNLHMATYLAYRGQNPSNTRSISPCKVVQTLEIRPSTIAVFESHDETLQDVFKAYCSYLSSKTDYKMKTMNLLNMFKDASLLNDFNGSGVKEHTEAEENNTEETSIEDFEKPRPMSRTKLDLFLKKLPIEGFSSSKKPRNFDEYLATEEDADQNGQASQSQQRGVTFEVFLKVIEFVATNTYPFLDEASAVKCVIENHLEKLLKTEKVTVLGSEVKEQLKQLMQMLKDPAVMDVISVIKKKLQPFYKEYCLPHEDYVGFEGFLSFYRFFGIFPHLMSRLKLMQLFHNLAALYPLVKQKNESRTPVKKNYLEENRKGIIDENLFIEAIIICAVEADEIPEKHTIERVHRVLCLLAKMEENIARMIDKSKGTPFAMPELTKKHRALEEIINYIHVKYPNPFQDKPSAVAKRIKKFEDLFN